MLNNRFPKQRYRWHIITRQAPFAPRDGAGALVFQEKMWLLGGWNPQDKIHFPRICNSEVWSSTNGREWTLEVLNAPWEGRHCAGYVVHRDRMWIVGGDGSHGHYQNDVWSSADGVHWDNVGDNGPWGPRVLHYTLAFRGKIWLMGGQTSPHHAPADERFYSDVWNSSDGQTWQRVTETAPWGPRGMIGGSVVFNDRMWILGGGTSETPRRPDRVTHNDVWYSADGVEWAEVRYTPWAARHAASVFVYHDALWLVAGNNLTSDVWKLMRAEEVFVP